jgi:hypothetical protein
VLQFASCLQRRIRHMLLRVGTVMPRGQSVTCRLIHAVLLVSAVTAPMKSVVESAHLMDAAM